MSYRNKNSAKVDKQIADLKEKTRKMKETDALVDALLRK